MNMNHMRIDPQIERCVSQVQWFVIRPAFKQTVTTTYWKTKIKSEKIYNNVHKSIVMPWMPHIPYTQYCRVQDNRRFCHFPKWFRCRTQVLAPSTKWPNAPMHCQSKSKIRAHWIVLHFAMAYTGLDILTLSQLNTLYQKCRWQTVAMPWKIHYTSRLSSAHK